MNFLISYPRSGNTLFRYCVEYISQRPTLPCFSDYTGHPIFSISGSGIKISNFVPILAKEHHWEHFEFRLTRNSKITIMIRDYKKCILSHIQRSHKEVKFEAMAEEVYHYLSLIKRFHEYNGEKLIIYFEDFMSNPENELNRFFDFVSFKNVDINSFIRHYDYHFQKSKKLYPAGMIKRTKISQNKQKILNNYIKFLDCKLFDNYLLRYSDV